MGCTIEEDRFMQSNVQKKKTDSVTPLYSKLFVVVVRRETSVNQVLVNKSSVNQRLRKRHRLHSLFLRQTAMFTILRTALGTEQLFTTPLFSSSPTGRLCHRRFWHIS